MCTGTLNAPLFPAHLTHRQSPKSLILSTINLRNLYHTSISAIYNLVRNTWTSRALQTFLILAMLRRQVRNFYLNTFKDV